jgi:phage terminase Nu1 subunit (DNA packaging protein)
VEFEEGFSPTEFNRKLMRLDAAIKRGEAATGRPVVVNAAERRALTRAYRADLEARIRSFYKDNPASMQRALERLRASDIDHILDLQLQGQNVRGNLKSLHSATNQGLGRQIQRQVPAGEAVPVEDIVVKP